MNRLRPILIVLLFVSLPMAMLYTLWGDPLSAGEDDVVYYYPLRVMTAEHLKHGELPLYNPREATGMPLMADPQTAVLHPTTWLFVMLPPKLAYSLSIFAAFSLAGGGAYLYMRRLGLVRTAAMFGAIAMMFCGFMVGHRVHLAVILTAAMLPWGLWVIESLRRKDFTTENTENTEKTEKRFIETTTATAKTKTNHQEHEDHQEHEEKRKHSSEEANQQNGTAHALRPTRHALRAALCLTPVLFLAIAAGHWPTLVHMAIVWTFYAMIRVRPFWSGAAMGAAAAALAVAMAWPQIHITSQLMAEVTRNKIGYATAGENSFLPTSAILGLMPFFQGTRNPNLFNQPWWGSWHLCEMLGYVGLATLALAGGCIWRLYRKSAFPSGSPHSLGGTLKSSCGCLWCSERHPQADLWVPPGNTSEPEPRFPNPVPLVRTWTWLIVGAGIFMLGYYLPTYKLIHMLPVLGVVRCPARMVLAVDMGLAVLAAIAIHCVMVAPADDRVRRLRHTIKLLAVVVLPLTMLVMVRFWAIAGQWLLAYYPDKFPALPFDGGAKAALEAANITNPAVFIPAIMMLLTAVVLVLWLRQKENPQSAIPQSSIVNRQSSIRFGAILILLLLADLFWITRFVDVPSRPGPNVETSPAAEWLKQHDPDTSSYRVWGLSKSYHDRPDELLLPKTCEAMGFQTIGNYGPFQSPAHVQLFGFRPWGECHDLLFLLRKNNLLSLYGVKYILVEGNKTLDRVVVRTERDAPNRRNLLGGNWQIEESAKVGRFGMVAKVDGAGSDQVITLKTPFMFMPSQAWQEFDPFVFWGYVTEPPLLLSFDARGPEGGAAGFLRVEICSDKATGKTIEAEQIGLKWRHFELVPFFPPEISHPGTLTFRLLTLSERPIEVKNISLRHIGYPVWSDHPVRSGAGHGNDVYKKLIELPPVNPGDPPVAIYENRLWRPISDTPKSATAEGCHPEVPTNEQLESLKWPAAGTKLANLAPLDISIRPVDSPSKLLWCVTLPAMILYGLVVVLLPRRGSIKRNRESTIR